MQTGESYLGCHIHVDTLVSRTIHPESGDSVQVRARSVGRMLVCVLEVIGVPSRLRLTRKASPTFALSCEENVSRRKWKSPLEYYTS